MTEKIFANLRDLLGYYGTTPYGFGRQCYKYTDCGPWTAFIVEVEPARDEQVALELTEQVGDDGKRELAVERIDNNPVGQDAERRFVKFLGLEREDPAADNLTDYAVLLDNYVHRKNADRRDVQVRYSAEPDRITVTLSRAAPPTYRTVYYEDKEARSDDGDTLPAWVDQCVAVDIGSIVEGSDVCIDPDRLSFPFTADDLDVALRNVNEAAAHYWRRDNGIHGRIQRLTDTGRVETGFDWYTFDDAPQFDNDAFPVADIPPSILDWIRDQSPNDDGHYTVGDWTVTTYCDDSTF